jgi:hypothetical protein
MTVTLLSHRGGLGTNVTNGQQKKLSECRKMGLLAIGYVSFQPQLPPNIYVISSPPIKRHVDEEPDSCIFDDLMTQELRK